MFIYFTSRDKARAATVGRMVDNGPDAPKGKRYARKLSGISGNSRQRKQAGKRAIRMAKAH